MTLEQDELNDLLILAKIKIQDGERQYDKFFKVNDRKEANEIVKSFCTFETKAQLMFCIKIDKDELEILEFYGVI